MDYLGPYLQSLSEGTQVVQQLRTAALQQQELEERKRQFNIEQGLRQQEFQKNSSRQDLSSRLELASHGAQPIDNGTFGANMSVPQAPMLTGGAPGGSMPEGGMPAFPPAPPVGPQDNTIPQPPPLSGGAMPQFTQQPNATMPTRVPVGPQDNTVSYGGNAYRIPSQQENDARELSNRMNQARALGTFVPLPQPLADSLYPNGNGPSEVNSGVLSGLQNTYRDVNDRKDASQARLDAANRPPATKAPEDVITLNKGDAALLGIPEGTQMPIKEYDARRGMYAAQSRAQRADRGGLTAGQQGVQERFDERQRNQGQNTINALQVKEQALHKNRMDWGNAMTAKDGEQVVDPETNKVVAMNAGRRKLYQQKIDSASAQVDALQRQQGDISTRFGGDPQQSTVAAPQTNQTEQQAPQQPSRWNMLKGVFTGGLVDTQQQPAPQAPAAPQASSPGRGGAPVAKTVRVKGGDGRTGTIPASNLAAAKKLDPKLQVLGSGQ